MALKILVTADSGLTVENSYARIEWFNGSKEAMGFSLNYYVSQEALQEGKSMITQKMFSFRPLVNIDSDNFIKQGYEYLKTLPEFEGATDVLE